MNLTLALRSVAISVGQRRLISGLDLDVMPGEVVTVMGPSGSGKSTLLDFIGGHLGPAFSASGQIAIGGTDVTALPPHRRRTGLLFQDDLLFPHLSVWQNIAFGLNPAVAGKRARRDLVEAELARAGLTGFADRDPATLSGGQRARVALLRTLLAGPSALLLDEPFNRLDAELKSSFRSLVVAEAARRGLPTILVTHDREDATDRVITLTADSAAVR